MDRRDFVRLGIAAAGAAAGVASVGIATAATRDANVMLNVQFDIGQASQQLNWYFSDARGKINPKAGGAKAGLLAFRIGDSLGLSISADSEAGQLQSVRVVDCTLVTLPLANPWEMEKPGYYPMPSPFYKVDGSSGVMTSFMPVTLAQASSRQHIFTGTPVTFTSLGRYKLTFMITVAITEANGATSHRVFYFDPECDVGTGAD
jgi:hypothetical protein